jgi:type IV pilus assembly protein PilA
MKTLRRLAKRGFTLIELMIVVAIIGILAVLAVFGVRRYLASAKSGEAMNTIGKINSQAIAAYDREQAAAELQTGGGASGQAIHQFCGKSTVVPVGAGSVKNVKYTPSPADYVKRGVGNDEQNGWLCLKFEMTEPQYYQYSYTNAAAGQLAAAVAGVAAPGGGAWVSDASGDLDGNGILSYFATGGGLNTNNEPIPYTQIYKFQPEE